MTDIKQFQPVIRHDDDLCSAEPTTFLSMRQTDIKPMLKVLAGLCLFFGALAMIVACGAVVFVLIRSLARLF
jgi:hypothetical protein